MSNNKIIVGKDLYELPAPKTFLLFEEFQNAAILEPDETSEIFNRRSVIDSVNLAGTRPDSQKRADMLEMIARHGGKRIGAYTPESAVA